MQTPSDLLYTKSHEWIKVEADGSLLIGITGHAQDALGDIVFLELPTVGQSIKAGTACCVIESVKAASDIYSPVDGEVVEINEELANTPHKINENPYECWMFKVKPVNNGLDNLLSAEQYLNSLGE